MIVGKFSEDREASLAKGDRIVKNKAWARGHDGCVPNQSSSVEPLLTVDDAYVDLNRLACFLGKQLASEQKKKYQDQSFHKFLTIERVYFANLISKVFDSFLATAKLFLTSQPLDVVAAISYSPGTRGNSKLPLMGDST